jgi:UDP-N-acetylmuramyl-tripeptide synthetase
MKLGQLISAVANARLRGGDVEIRAVQDDSRAVQAGDVFVAVKGLHVDGHAFIDKAIANGAAAIVAEREIDTKLPLVIVPSTQIALGLLVGRSLGDPAKAMTLIGVTGTNGKTTTTYLVEAILRAAGKRPGVIGTVEMRVGDKVLPADYTTPTPQILHGALAQMREAGCTHVVMEVTSSALAMERVVGLQFAVSAFSNLTQDHLDVHGSMAAYRDAKRRLFAELTTGIGVVNIDDPEGEGMGRVAPKMLSVGAHGDIRIVRSESSVAGIRMTLATPRGELEIISKPPGSPKRSASITPRSRAGSPIPRRRAACSACRTMRISTSSSTTRTRPMACATCSRRCARWSIGASSACSAAAAIAIRRSGRRWARPSASSPISRS